MAKMILPTNFLDDIPSESMNGKRRYRLINNTDGTVSLEDVTAYDQVGSAFGSGQINATNTAVNASADAGKIIDSLDTIKATTQAGYMAGALALKQQNEKLKDFEPILDSTGKITGYKTAIGGADTVFPFSRNYISIDEYKTSMQPTHYNIGFRPKLVVCGADVSAQLCWYNAETNKCYYGSDSKHGVDLGVSLRNTYRFDSIDDMGFTFSVIPSTYNNQDMIIFAMG